MVKSLLYLFLLFIGLSGTAQDENLYFSEALTMHLPKYDSKAEKAYRRDNVDRAEFLFDSLVKNCLKGSYMDDFVVRDLNKKNIRITAFKKPVYLVTKASWLVPTEGEVPALNELAAKYHDKIDFVLLFWDDHKTAQNQAKKYHKSIAVLYVDEMNNQSNYVIRKMKHSLGVPTSFLLNPAKQIVDIRRSVSHPYGLKPEQSYDLNYQAFSEGISALLLHDSSKVTEYKPKGALH